MPGFLRCTDVVQRDLSGAGLRAGLRLSLEPGVSAPGRWGVALCHPLLGLLWQRPGVGDIERSR